MIDRITGKKIEDSRNEKPLKSVCAWCFPHYCREHPEENVTSGMCPEHFKRAVEEIEQMYSGNAISPEKMAAAPGNGAA